MKVLIDEGLQQALNKISLEYQRYFVQDAIDLVIRRGKELYLYEIKNSSKIVEAQSKHIRNKELLTYWRDKGYTIKEQAVLYNGQTNVSSIESDRIQYKNISEFLLSVKDCGKLATYYEKAERCEYNSDNLTRFRDIYKTFSGGYNEKLFESENANAILMQYAETKEF